MTLYECERNVRNARKQVDDLLYDTVAKSEVDTANRLRKLNDLLDRTESSLIDAQRTLRDLNG